MKRLLLFLLAALMLSGCARRPGTQSTESTEVQTEGLYVENSAVETQTGGAVRLYELKESYFRISSIGNNLLLMGENGFAVLSGQKGELIATMQTNEITSATVVDTALTGMAYYRPDTRQVIVCNPLLQSSAQIQLPEGVVDEPRISLAKNEIYYVIGNEIRAINMDTGISRLIRQQSSISYQKLLGDGFCGSVLQRMYTEEGGEPKWDFISTETGESLGDAMGVSRLYTDAVNYVAFFEDGPINQIAFGARGVADAYRYDARRFAAPMEESLEAGYVPVIAQNGIVGYESVNGSLNLSFFDLHTGIRSAQVQIGGEGATTLIHSDGKYVWVLCENRLYRWDITKTPSPDSKLYIAPLYTAQQPDEEGLSECQALADSMSKQYGVKLLIWENAVQKTGEYTVTAEHHTQIITAMLECLEPLLAKFPERFLQTTIKNGWIRIALVRDISGPDGCVQFWENGDSYILLSTQDENAVLEKMIPAIISHVRGNSRDLDEDRWGALNPKDFAYMGNNSQLEKPEYLEGDNRAFADSISMRYPYEDQGRILYYAMQENNADMFRSPIMQAKLLQLCMGIREAYDLQKKTETFVWEQYLQTSLAYVK